MQKNSALSVSQNNRPVVPQLVDLCRVNFEVTNPKLFPYLAFPQRIRFATRAKTPSFDGELMASFTLHEEERHGADLHSNSATS